MDYPRVVLLPRRARPFYGRHPWVYAGAIAAVHGEPQDGEVVDLCSHADNFVARGIYNSRSKIRVRLYSWSSETPLDAEFFRQRLRTAFHLRHSILRLTGSGQAYRCVFSEGDGLSGLTIDLFDRWCVIQFTSLAMAQRREMWADLVTELVQPLGIYMRTERGIGKVEGLELQDGFLRGSVPNEPIAIVENNLQILVNLLEGQKTGYYLDQRNNRLAVAPLAAGRRVLDAFCYTGGFGLHAAKAGARDVMGVDVSQPALNLAAANARLNGLTCLSFVQEDVFESLNRLHLAGEKFGLVILDPPKFARTRSAIDEALRGYRRLQTLTLRILEGDGILVTCCCSGLISLSMLESLLAQLGADEKRDIQILERRGQGPDHPVSAFCPESNYLKCLIARVG
jgi:23S rRNA (cytosine1962-C5)-methyltransferase